MTRYYIKNTMGRRLEITTGAMLEAYASGKSIREVASDYGVSASAVQKRLHGLVGFRRENEKLKDVRLLLQQGFHHAEVARMTGYCVRSVCAEKRKLGLAHRLTDEQKSQIVNMRSRGVTMREIAEVLGVKDYVVFNYVSRMRKAAKVCE